MSQNEDTPINEIPKLSFNELIALKGAKKERKAVTEREDKVTLQMILKNDVDRLNEATDKPSDETVTVPANLFNALSDIGATLLIEKNFPAVYAQYKIAYRQANPKTAAA